MKIRSATGDDLPHLAALWQERRVILQQFDPRFTVPATDAWITETELYIASADHALFLAEKRDSATSLLIGGIMGRIHEDKVGIVEDIALDAHTYHAGLGRALWQTLKQWFADHNTEYDLIHIPRYYPVEQAFWRALGAKEWKNNAWKTPPERMWMTL